LAWAALSFALVTFSPLVLKTGPIPDVFGAGRFTPLTRMHAAKAVSAFVLVGLFGARLPPAMFPPPHFARAASN
jgi:hypothetical protein